MGREFLSGLSKTRRVDRSRYRWKPMQGRTLRSGEETMRFFMFYCAAANIGAYSAAPSLAGEAAAKKKRADSRRRRRDRRKNSL